MPLYCAGSRLFCEYLHIPELSDTLLLHWKIIVGGRLSVCQQDELRSARTEYAAFHAVGTTYTTGIQHQIVHRMASMEIQTCTGFRKVKLNDIVVFNFPAAGDTVALNRQQTDFTP